MSFMDKFRNLMGEEDDYSDEYIDDAPQMVNNNRSADDGENEAIDAPVDTGSKKNRVVNINATTQIKVVLVKPETFEEASTIYTLSLHDALPICLVDFLSGVAYANNGQIKRVANSTFIITPYNVDIMGDDLMDELQNNGALS